MSNLNSISQSLFTKQPDKSGASQERAQLQQAVQKFEGLLWDQVAQAMSSVKLGPSDLGQAGQTYQRMLWHKIATQDFADTDQGLTRSTLSQLMPDAARDSNTTAPVENLASVRSTGAATGSDQSQGTALQWAQHIWHAIESGAKTLGVPAKGLMAQAALETGWGQHAQDHNLFGVKSHGQGPSFSALTHEFSDGVLRQVRSAFQSYQSVAHSVGDFVQVLQNLHPQAVGQSTVAGYAQALQNSGYATDPRYASKIESIATSPRMQALLDLVKH